MVDALYAKLNSRGKKQFKVPTSRQSFSQNFAEYANLGLPAHKAALEGNVECLKECFCCYMKEGVPSRDVNGATPLHLAARNNRADSVKWLIRFTDLSPTVTAKHGETPAHVAAAQGHVESLKQMLTADGKEDVKSKLCTVVDNSGFSVLHLAIVKHRNECAKFLITELGTKAVNSLNESGVTAAHISASAGNTEVLLFLHTKHKKLLHQEDKEGASPTYYAAQEGRLDVLKFMHERCKCDLSRACRDGLKPIHAASQCGHTNIVKYIVSQTGNQSIFDTTPDGATPLHFATSSGQESTAQWLINSDASGTLVTSKDKNGDTPAHDAAESGHVAMLKLLLENGADLYAINNDGGTPYSLALSGGNMDVANFVMTFASKAPSQRDSMSSVRIFSMQGDVDVVDMNKSPDSQEEISLGTALEMEPIGSSKAEEPLLSSGKHKSPFKSSRDSGKKGKGSDKKEKKKSKKEEKSKKTKSTSFMGNMSQTLQSFDSSQSSSKAKGDGDTALDMTEDDLNMFSDMNPLVSSPSEDDNILVRYSAPAATNPISLEDQPDPGYSTISELEQQKEKRDKKMERKVAKSLQKAIKPGKGDGAGKKGQRTSAGEIGGVEMGFKPQFRTNPLAKLGGSIPPTPPPTPATAASIATSDDTPQHNLEEVEEIENGEEFSPNDDGYSTYAVPDPEVVKMKAARREMEEQEALKTSANQKLLKDALQDLSGDESPPETKLDGAKASKKPVTTRPIPPKEEDANKNRFPVLKSAKRDVAPLQKPKTELSQIKLKKTSDWKRAEYSHPDTETTSGASDELKNILKRKVVEAA